MTSATKKLFDLVWLHIAELYGVDFFLNIFFVKPRKSQKQLRNQFSLVMIAKLVTSNETTLTALEIIHE